MIDTLLSFIRQHPAPGAPVWEAERFLTTLISGPEGILVRPSRDAPAALAVLLDTCQTTSNAAELLLLGVDETRATQGDLLSIAAEAEQKIRGGPRTCLEIATFDGCPWPKALLARTGFSHAFSLYELEQPLEGALSPPRRPLREGLSFEVLRPERALEYVAMVRRVMGEIEGVALPPLEEYLRHTRETAACGTIRVVVDVSAAENGAAPPLVAWVRTALDEVAGHGEIFSLGCEASHRGLGIGVHLVAEGIQNIQARGAKRARIQVAASNPKALGLYQKMGFALRQETKMLRKRL